MKIRIKSRGIGTIKEFDNKAELVKFIKRDIENKDYNNPVQEKFKFNILFSKDCRNFSITELVDMIDYDIVRR